VSPAGSAASQNSPRAFSFTVKRYCPRSIIFASERLAPATVQSCLATMSAPRQHVRGLAKSPTLIRSTEGNGQ
jgi:hypothetical protein